MASRLCRAIHHSWNLALHTHAAGGILVELALTGRCCYDFLTNHDPLPSGTVKQLLAVSF